MNPGHLHTIITIYPNPRFKHSQILTPIFCKGWKSRASDQHNNSHDTAITVFCYSDGMKNVSRAKYSGPKSHRALQMCIAGMWPVSNASVFHTQPAAETFESHHRLCIFKPRVINGPPKGLDSGLISSGFGHSLGQLSLSRSPNQKGRFYFSAGLPSPRWPSKDNLPPPSPFCNLNYTRVRASPPRHSV